MVTDSRTDETVGTATAQAARTIDRATTGVTHLNLLGVLNEGDRDDVIARLEDLRQWADEACKALRRGPESVKLFEGQVRQRDASRGDESRPVSKLGRVAARAAVVSE